jgi:hypothetical protein
MQRLHENSDDLHPVMDELTHSSLGKIIQKAKWLLAMDRALQTILPPGFSAHVHVMNLNQQTLVLGVRSSAVATRIQFMAADLIQSLQKTDMFQIVREIQCKVCAKHVSY